MRQNRQTQFKAKGKSAKEMRARTTPSFEETKSANMQDLGEKSKIHVENSSCSLYCRLHALSCPVETPKNIREPGLEAEGNAELSSGV